MKSELENPKAINCLYSHFKNVLKKLKIVCDWDEVIQSLEPYALWKVINKTNEHTFSKFFKDFWKDGDDNEPAINYSPYGSSLKTDNYFYEEQQKVKNSPNFYQEAPFLSIAKELLMLIKAGKVEQLIFLSAYDKRVFADGDPRKKEIFAKTFGKVPTCSLSLVGFNSEKTGKTKSEWIKENAADCNIVIDDNPNILVNVLKENDEITAVAPHYPAVANQHHKDILLVKTSVSDLKKENF